MSEASVAEMIKRISPEGVHSATVFYSHCVVTPASAALVFVSGQVGIDAEGVLAPEFGAQIRQAWRNVVACLRAAGAELDDLVQTRSYIVDGQDLQVFQQVRREFLAKEPPSSTVLIVPRLMSPAHLFEVEVIAALPR
jgi:2-iminobutanoate/2-iminopropanoate deaminase